MGVGGGVSPPPHRRLALKIGQIMNPTQLHVVAITKAWSHVWVRLVVLAVLLGLMATVATPVHVH